MRERRSSRRITNANSFSLLTKMREKGKIRRSLNTTLSRWTNKLYTPPKSTNQMKQIRHTPKINQSNKAILTSWGNAPKWTNQIVCHVTNLPTKERRSAHSGVQFLNSFSGLPCLELVSLWSKTTSQSQGAWWVRLAFEHRLHRATNLTSNT